MTTLILVRHGQTDWNHQRRIQGSTDIPLNEVGREQAREVAVALRDELPAGPVAVASSDLSRASETASIIAAMLGVEAPLTYPQLRERGYGDAEGLDVTAFRERFGDWHADVPNAESWSRLRVRALRGVDAAIRDMRRRTAPAAATLVVVSHGALIRELIRHATGGAFPPEHVRLPNGSRHVFRVERERMQLLSYTAHSDLTAPVR